jgi:Legionella pneumophila major outer membrane protein precursor
MRVRLAAVLALVVAVVAGPRPVAAQFVAPGPPDWQGAVFLAPVDAGAGRPVFVAAEPGPAVASLGAGLVGGQAVSTWGTLGVGFDYLRPLWTFRDFTLAVPAANAASFPFFGDTGNVDSQFAFAPRVDYHYRFTDYNLGVRATGTFLNLSGHLQRDLATAAGTGQLTAASNLTIVAANLVEFTRRLELAELLDKDWGECEGLEKLLVDVGIGTRYSSITQDYTSTLVSAVGAANQSTRYSVQSFQGIGLTGSMNVVLPLTDNLVAFSDTRASVLVGENRKESSLTVVVAGQPGRADKIAQARTEFIPVVELELGMEWGRELVAHLRDQTAGFLFTVRAAFVGQFWGDVGPLSAGSAQGFRRSDLFLVGANVMVGLHR